MIRLSTISSKIVRFKNVAAGFAVDLVIFVNDVQNDVFCVSLKVCPLFGLFWCESREASDSLCEMIATCLVN